MGRPVKFGVVKDQESGAAAASDSQSGSHFFLIKIKEGAVIVDPGNTVDTDIDLVGAEQGLGARTDRIAVFIAQSPSGNGYLKGWIGTDNHGDIEIVGENAQVPVAE
jgi:hypothetical protein